MTFLLSVFVGHDFFKPLGNFLGGLGMSTVLIVKAVALAEHSLD